MRPPHNITAVECDTDGRPTNPYAGAIKLYAARRLRYTLEIAAILTVLGGAVLLLALWIGVGLQHIDPN